MFMQVKYFPSSRLQQVTYQISEMPLDQFLLTHCSRDQTLTSDNSWLICNILAIHYSLLPLLSESYAWLTVRTRCVIGSHSVTS